MNAQCFAKLIGHCYMGDSRQKAPSRNQSLERVEDALVKGNYCWAMGLLFHGNLLNPNSPERIKTTHELHPEPFEGYEPPVP